MKNLLLLLLFIPVLGFSQNPMPPVFYNTRADLRLQKGTEGTYAQINGLVTSDDGNSGSYMWKSSNTDADDGFVTLQVTGVTTGRWKRVGNGTTIKFSKSLSGAVLQTAYNVSFDTTLPFTPITIIINPRSANAAVPSWISSISNTGFTINFSSVPILGTNNILIDIIVVKQ